MKQYKCNLCGKHYERDDSLSVIARVQLCNVIGIPICDTLYICDECASNIVNAVIKTRGLEKLEPEVDDREIEVTHGLNTAIVVESDDLKDSVDYVCFFTYKELAAFVPCWKTEKSYELKRKFMANIDTKTQDYIELVDALTKTFDSGHGFYNPSTVKNLNRYSELKSLDEVLDAMIVMPKKMKIKISESNKNDQASARWSEHIKDVDEIQRIQKAAMEIVSNCITDRMQQEDKENEM